MAKEVRVSIDTARRWVEVLRNLHLGFLVRPWFKNVTRSLRKEPKWFLHDWSSIDDVGDRAETFVGFAAPGRPLVVPARTFLTQLL